MPRYIDAEKMQSLLEEEIEGCGYPISENKPIAYGTTLGLKMALSYTKTLSTADVAPVVHAHWDCYKCSRFLGWKDGEPEPRWADGKLYYCSRCRRSTVIRENYCPNCGARMDKEVKE